MGKISSLLYEEKLDNSNENSEEGNRKKQELDELETQYETLSKALEDKGWVETTFRLNGENEKKSVRFLSSDRGCGFSVELKGDGSEKT